MVVCTATSPMPSTIFSISRPTPSSRPTVARLALVSSVAASTPATRLCDRRAAVSHRRFQRGDFSLAPVALLFAHARILFDLDQGRQGLLGGAHPAAAIPD